MVLGPEDAGGSNLALSRQASRFFGPGGSGNQLDAARGLGGQAAEQAFVWLRVGRVVLDVEVVGVGHRSSSGGLGASSVGHRDGLDYPCSIQVCLFEPREKRKES